MRVKAAETGNVSFRSDAAEVIIGEKPAAKYETPDIRIDYTAETLTGFAPGAEYAINGKNITASADGVIKIEADWFGTTLSIVRKGNGNDKLDSNAQRLPVPARPQKPTPIGVDVSTAGETGKLTGLTADTIYEVSNDGGKIWVSHTADGSGQIIGLAPGAYVVRVKAGTSNFVSEPSDPAQIGAYPIKVTFMVDGAKYKEITVHYGAALTDISPVPTKENAVGAWCMDEQGTAPAAFTNITADMTVYAVYTVYTTVYAVTLQTGTGYTLMAQSGSESPVKEGGIEAYREEAPGLVRGMYVDISMFIRIGAGDWNAITETKEPIEVVIGISEELQSDGRVFYIIRAHEGAYTFMNDLDDAPDTITVSTDLFSSYAIAYAEADETGTDDGAKCGLCHICPTFLGICYFIWLAVIIALGLILYIMWRKKRQKEEKNE